MPRKTRGETLDQYRQRIDRARRWRDQEGLDETWWRLNDLYRGRHWPRSTTAQRDLIAVNLSFSTVNVIAPSVSVNHPKIVVSANEPQNGDRAAFVEAVVNHMWRQCTPSRAVDGRTPCGALGFGVVSVALRFTG